MTTPDPTTIDATAAVPIDLASKLALGAYDLTQRWDAWTTAQSRKVRGWWLRQEFKQDQVLGMVTLAIYALVAVVEAWAYGRKRAE